MKIWSCESENFPFFNFNVTDGLFYDLLMRCVRFFKMSINLKQLFKHIQKRVNEHSANHECITFMIGRMLVQNARFYLK